MTEAWEWPQWVMGGWFIFAAFVAVLVNGMPREGTYNGALMLLIMTVEVLVIWAGGFWS